jgi:N-glycosylase/DNA lyase
LEVNARDCAFEGLDSTECIQALTWVTVDIPIPVESVTVAGVAGELEMEPGEDWRDIDHETGLPRGGDIIARLDRIIDMMERQLAKPA